MLDMVLVSELLRPSKAWAYPYNSLRNQVGAVVFFQGNMPSKGEEPFKPACWSQCLSAKPAMHSPHGG